MNDESGIIESVKDALKKRMTSIWAGTFVLAWATWNYRFLVVVFSEGPYEKKLAFIDKGLSHSPGEWESLWPPIVCAIAYVVFAPLLSLVVEAWHGLVRALHRRLQLWQEQTRPMSREQVLEMSQGWQKKEQALKEEIAQLSAQLAAASSATANARAVARTHLIKHARSSFALCNLEPISVRLSKLSRREGLSDHVKRVLESVNGLPWPSYLMLRILSTMPARYAEQLARDAELPVSASEPEALLFLVGGGLVDVVWEAEAQPLFRISSAGRRLMQLCSESYADVLVRPSDEQWAIYEPESSEPVHW